MDCNANQKVSCIANYAYDASEPDELSLRPGDIVRDVERLPGGWWRGELKGKKGMFPDNFVSIVDHASSSTRTNAVQGRCRAVFSYNPVNPDELPLCVGDVLEVLGEVEEGWWQGRRQGRVGVFPSNFVVMLEPTVDPVPALPPKPVKEYCRVLFPYTAVNEDELSLAEGDVVTLLSRDAPDRGWWRGEVRGRVGLFPDNFVQILPNTPVPHELEEKKPDRPPSAKSTSPLYPSLTKYSEKSSSLKELTTVTKISMHKDNSLSKETLHSELKHTNKSESDKIIHNETTDLDGQIKKPPVPVKKSPTPTVGSLLSGLKNKMLSSSSEKEKSLEKSPTISSSASNSSGEWDKPDGGAASKASNSNTNTLDHVERNCILQDPRAGRVKAPRRRPPSAAFRDDLVPDLTNGHEAEKQTQDLSKDLQDKTEEIKPKAREWEKHRAPWMEELKLNQAKKTSLGTEKKGTESLGRNSTGSTDRILDLGLEEKRVSQSTEMSKSTSSISNRVSVVERVIDNFEEVKVRHPVESKSETITITSTETAVTNKVQSPTAAGRTLSTIVDEIKKPPAPSPPTVSIRTTTDLNRNSLTETKKPERNSTNSIEKPERNSLKDRHAITTSLDKAMIVERLEQQDKGEKLVNNVPLDRRGDLEALVAQLSNRVLNLEKLLEVQNAKFNATIEELSSKLTLETEKRLSLQAEVEKLAHCVTQV